MKYEIGEMGVYEGPESVKRFLTALAARERFRGQMIHIMLMNPYIMVSKDGKTAKGMWWAFGPCADYCTPYPGDEQKLTAYWLCGKYDKEYVKEDGRWKLLSLHMMVYFRSPCEQGWLKEPDCARWQALTGAPPYKPQSLIDPYHPDGICNWKPVPYPYEPIEL